jgi:peptidyl-prolyl cis-trans isomerase C
VTLVVDTNVTKPPAPPVTVSVNGVAIPRDVIQREMQHHPAAKSIVAWQRAAEALVVRELLLQRARYLGVAGEPGTDAEGRRETDEEALIRALVEQEVTVPEPDEETCWRYYERNRSRFRSPDIYEAAHILFAASSADRAAYAQARADAEALLAILRDNPDRFAELARTHSRCPSAAQGGNLGQITRGQTTAEFERALINLQPGAICATPVESRYGIHIIRLDRKHDGRVLSYEAVAGRTANYLRESVRRRAAAQYIARLVSAAKIEGVELTGAEALRVH